MGMLLNLTLNRVKLERKLEGRFYLFFGGPIVLPPRMGNEGKAEAKVRENQTNH